MWKKMQWYLHKSCVYVSSVFPQISGFWTDYFWPNKVNTGDLYYRRINFYLSLFLLPIFNPNVVCAAFVIQKLSPTETYFWRTHTSITCWLCESMLIQFSGHSTSLAINVLCWILVHWQNIFKYELLAKIPLRFCNKLK